MSDPTAAQLAHDLRHARQVTENVVAVRDFAICDAERLRGELVRMTAERDDLQATIAAIRGALDGE